MNLAINEELLEHYDSSEETLLWSETYVVYNVDENATYKIRFDQDGGESIFDIVEGKGY